MRRLLLKAILIGVLSCAFGQDTLRVGYNVAPPFIIENEAHLDGINMWLWRHIGEETGIQYEFVKMPLDSIIKSLSTNDIQVAINPLTISDRRSHFMDFTAPYFITQSSFLTNTDISNDILDFIPSILTISFFKSAFTLLIMVLIFGVIFWLVERRKNTQHFSNSLMGIINGIWFSIVSLTTVGYGDVAPVTKAGKAITVIWLFLSIIFVSGFTASVASSLTVSDLSTNPEDVFTYKHERIGTVRNSVTEHWLTHHFFSDVVPFMNIEEAIKSLQNREIDVIAYDEPVLRYYEREVLGRDYETKRIVFNPQMISFGYSDELPDEIKEKIDHALLKIIKTEGWRVVLNTYGIYENESLMMSF